MTLWRLCTAILALFLLDVLFNGTGRFTLILTSLQDYNKGSGETGIFGGEVKVLGGWRRGSVVRTSVCSRRTFPDLLRPIHG